MPENDPALPLLDDVLDDAWRRLAQGVADRRDAFHLTTLATSDADGRAVARTVVLRGADPDARIVRCHTDTRSPKVNELAVRPWASWVCYDPEARIQVRVAGPTRVGTPADDAAAVAAWTRASASARRCYMAPAPPSARSDGPSANLPEGFHDHNPDLDTAEVGAAHFGVVTTTVQQLDWLRLRAEGHTRAGFRWDDAGRLDATWLEP